MFWGSSSARPCFRAVDWVLLHVPIVTTIYKALTNVAQSLGNQMQSSPSKRIVLVEFPHLGMRALAFVTNTLTDPKTEPDDFVRLRPDRSHAPRRVHPLCPGRVGHEPRLVGEPGLTGDPLSGGMTSPTVIDYPIGQHTPQARSSIPGVIRSNRPTRRSVPARI